MRHTQGPWRVVPYHYVLNEPTRARILGANGEPVVDDCNPEIADAYLIGAAPELLEACKLARKYVEGWVEKGCSRDALDQLDAALAKARGAPC